MLISTLIFMISYDFETYNSRYQRNETVAFFLIQIKKYTSKTQQTEEYLNIK
jgi:hypothetical protein